MFPSKSTAVSDVTLALSCIYAVIVLLREDSSAEKNPTFAVIWFALAGLSTVFGGCRYGKYSYSEM